eukprot:230944-Amphidinium_carterae.1
MLEQRVMDAYVSATQALFKGKKQLHLATDAGRFHTNRLFSYASIGSGPGAWLVPQVMSAHMHRKNNYSK